MADVGAMCGSGIVNYHICDMLCHQKPTSYVAGFVLVLDFNELPYM